MPEAPKLGLTTAEVEDRKKRGLDNRVDLSTSRSMQDILKANFLSIANVILLAIVAILVIVGKPADAFVTGGVVIINVFVGTFQEYRAKRKLDQIALLTRPQVRVIRDGQTVEISQIDVVVDDVVILSAGDQAVVDGKLIQDPRESGPSKRVDMDESMLTGESDLIPKYPSDQILSGSFCVVGRGLFVAEKVGNESFAQKITTGARQFTMMVTPLQKQISIIVRGLVVLSVALSVMLALEAAYKEKPFAESVEESAVAISLIPQGLLLMITVAYALGAVRIAAKGVLVQQSNAVESLSHVDVLCLDKTGTLTTNRILFNATHPLNGTDDSYLRQCIGDHVSSTGRDNRTAEAIAETLTGIVMQTTAIIPFSSARKWSGASYNTSQHSGTYILGAPEMVMPTADFDTELDSLAKQGLRVLLFAHSSMIIKPEDIPDDRELDLPSDLKPLGLISFTDELRPNVKDVLGNFRKAGITLKLISGDNPTTVGALARQAGFSDKDYEISGVELAQFSPFEFEQAVREKAIFGRITPEQKQAIVNVLRNDGHYVAMMGDGVNDVLSLKQAQVGISMEDGSQATRSVADIVLLGNKFESLPDAFLEGQRILNGMNDVTRLFLTRTLYTALLIIIVGFIGTEFPLTPRHNALLTTLPVGIPAFFLAAWAKTGKPAKDLITSVTEFVFPTGFTLMVVSVFIWILYRTYGVATVETSRTVLTTAALLGGLWVIILAEHDSEVWRNGHIGGFDRRRAGLAIAMLVLFGAIMIIPGIREFFEMTTLSWADLGTIAASMSVWAIGLYLIWRFEILEYVLVPNYQSKRADEVKHTE